MGLLSFNKKISFPEVIEPYLFYSLVLIGLIPLFTNKYFVTLDGPSHLYNGILLKSLITGEYPEIVNLYRINNFPVPNLISHVLFALFTTFLPDFLAEKTVLFMYLFLTPVLFRRVVFLMAPSNRVFSWWMIIFVHNQNFYLGFYNFSFGILFFFLILYYYLKKREIMKIRHLLVLSLLFLLTYFSHLFVFIISCSFLITLSLFQALFPKKREVSILSGLKNNAGETFRLLLISLPAIILTVFYLIKGDLIGQNADRLSFIKKLEWLTDIRPLLALRYGFPWKSFTYLLFSFMTVVVISQFITWHKSVHSKIGRTLRIEPVNPFQATVLFFLISILLLFFLLPNVFLLSERLILFFFLFFITWIAVSKHPRWIHFALAVVLIVFHFSFTRMYTYTLRGYSEKVIQVKEAVKDMEPGRLILPLNYNQKWIFMHIAGYAGTGKPMALLDNYEAALSWFQVGWGADYDYLKNLSVQGDNKAVACEMFIHPEFSGCFSLNSTQNNHTLISYVLVIKDMEKPDSGIPLCVSKVLNENYYPKCTNSFCTLYRIKNQ